MQDSRNKCVQTTNCSWWTSSQPDAFSDRKCRLELTSHHSTTLCNDITPHCASPQWLEAAWKPAATSTRKQQHVEEHAMDATEAARSMESRHALEARTQQPAWDSGSGLALELARSPLQCQRA